MNKQYDWPLIFVLGIMLTIFLLPAIIFLIDYNNDKVDALNECCAVQGGTPVVYSGCHSNFYANCSDAKSGWYCLLEGSEVNYTETFKGCSIQFEDDTSKDKG